MRKLLTVVVAAAMLLSVSAAFAGKDEKNAEKRAEIDRVAKDALDEILEKSKNAPGLYEKAYGYAVFDNMRITFIFTGGGGSGVAVNKASGARTYMKMGTGGLSLGIGAQKYEGGDRRHRRRRDRGRRRRDHVHQRHRRVPGHRGGADGVRRHLGHQVLGRQEAQQEIGDCARHGYRSLRTRWESLCRLGLQHPAFDPFESVTCHDTGAFNS
jgi:hypothetical protein